MSTQDRGEGKEEGVDVRGWHASGSVGAHWGTAASDPTAAAVCLTPLQTHKHTLRHARTAIGVSLPDGARAQSSGPAKALCCCRSFLVSTTATAIDSSTQRHPAMAAAAAR